MADLYSQPFRNSLKRNADEMSGNSSASTPSAGSFPSNGAAGMMYPQLLSSAPHSQPITQAPSPDEMHQQQQQQQNNSDDPETPPGSSKSPGQQQDCNKMETKPQATFLTKLYALLERPENHHMIRWDPQGEHIIVERPEQLALHVLPSIYRQSRFASFSRQLNIYGFMRKVNLRNIDPAIDDPDASTWSHPTLNRNSPPEVVANFKRRVPPRLPKPRKRSDINDGTPNGPRTGTMQVNPAMAPSMPSSVAMQPAKGRARGFSAPGSFNPLAGGAAGQWGSGGNGYPRSALPPLAPSEPHHPSHSNVYHRPSLQNLHIPQEDHNNILQPHHPHHQHHQQAPHHHSSFIGRDSTNSSLFLPHNYTPTYPENNPNNHSSWAYLPPLNTSPANLGPGHSGSLSSLLNPPNGLSRGGVTPTSAHSTGSGSNYPSPFSSVPMSNSHSSSSMSPDSRPTTGYSVASSMSSLPYDPEGPFEYRPRSGHGRPLTPGSAGGRPKSSAGPSSSLSVRRNRRHSQAVSPYPSPYSSYDSIRPLTAPDGTSHLPRVRSMAALSPTSENGPGPFSDFNPAHADFAYSAHGPTEGSGMGMDPGWMSGNGGAPGVPTAHAHSLSPVGGLSPASLGPHNGGQGNTLRPSTSTSSLSAQSSASATHTPPVLENFSESDINRFFP